MHVAEYLVNAKQTGILRDVAFLDKYQGVPGILYARPIVKPGEKVGRCLLPVPVLMIQGWGMVCWGRLEDVTSGWWWCGYECGFPTRVVS